MSVLDRILKQRLATRDMSMSLAELKSRARDMPVPRSFLGALERPDRLAVIAEIKFRSPSQGVLREADDVETCASSYSKNGADALSVLTESHSFGGALDYLNRAKQACALPILRKDFLYDEYDVFESRTRGADGILLIAKMLSRTQLLDLREFAEQVNLAVLLELHDEGDLAKSEGIHNVAWGVNHRNLDTLQIDMEVSERLLPLLPANEISVAESGLSTRADLQLMSDRGALAVLIGTSFMKRTDPGQALAELIS